MTDHDPRQTAPHGPHWDHLEGRLERFVFRREDGAWAVARVVDDQEQMHTVVGAMVGLEEGDRVRCEGRWIDDTRFGRQLTLNRVMPLVPSTELGIRRYLQGGAIPGVGPALAERIVHRFGTETLSVIEEHPERLCDVPGIGGTRAAAIAQALAERVQHRELIIFLRGHDIPPGLSARIVQQYGDQAMQVVRQQPYRLAEEVRGIGFKKADAIARNQGLALDHPDRLRAGLLHRLRVAASEGSAALPVADLVESSAQLLEVAATAVEAALAHATMQAAVRVENDGERDLCFLPGMLADEQRVASHLRRLSTSAIPRMAKQADQAVRWAEEQRGLNLGEDQFRALREGLERGCFVLTGGPGTGKTTIVTALLAIAEARGLKVALAAPTGRAAKRLGEATGREARTIHRLLEYNPGLGRFNRDAARPIEAQLLVVDEASMIDLALAAALLDAVPDGCRLWWVGDVDQLPSVGAGQVLRDIIDSDRIAVGRLETIHRQSEGSAIVEAAHRVRQGEFPAIRGEDFHRVAREEPERMLDAVLRTVAERIPAAFGLDPIRDVQVLTPMRRGALGSTQLNRALREALNPLSPEVGELQRGERIFRTGDRVIQVANDYERELFNGDTGFVRAVEPEELRLRIDFDGRILEIEGEALDRIEPAFALTIHKSQGSEYPAVVIALHHQHHIMLRRNLLYTALTLGKRLVVLVGPSRAIGRAVNNQEGDRRWSGLRRRIQRAFEGAT
jgi:exodeoxyribonuclease V alpha subunit